MTIEGQNARAETPNEVYDRVQKWVEEKQFGSPEYQAISDYLDLRRLKIDLREHLTDSVKAKDNVDRAVIASEIRMKEGEIILLSDHIRMRSSHQKGYENAYVEIENLLTEEVAGAAAREAVAEFPGNLVQQDAQADMLYTDFIYDIQDIVYRKRA